MVGAAEEVEQDELVVLGDVEDLVVGEDALEVLVLDVGFGEPRLAARSPPRPRGTRLWRRVPMAPMPRALSAR